MDAITENPLPVDEQKLVSIREKEKIAVLALRSVLDEIKSKDKFTPEEALDLAVKYASYAQEWHAYQIDAHEINNDIQSKYLGWHNEAMRHLPENALLLGIKDGDYRELKKYLKSEAIWYQNKEGKIIGDKLRMIVQQVPEHGQPLIPIKPAWMDERFNPGPEQVAPAQETPRLSPPQIRGGFVGAK